MFGITEPLAAAKELFQWMRIREEIEARRLLQEEYDRVDEENDKLTDAIHNARRDGLDGYADKLLDRQVRLVRYRAGIYSVEERANLYSAGRPNPGTDVSDKQKGSTDPRPAAGE